MPSRSHFELESRTIHIWPIRTAASIGLVSTFERLLAPHEQERAAEFHSDNHRISFIVARGALRTLLGSYLDTSASAIHFEYACNGKPTLAGMPITFNVSHSGDLAVFAFTRGCEIGIDVEQIRPIADMQSIAGRFFCPDEAAELNRIPAQERELAFFLCWTRKEAYLKAIGAGLSVPLNEFCVTFRSGERARFIHLGGNEAAANDWMLHDLRLAPDYAAALAYRDTERLLEVLPLIHAAELPGFLA